jgi:predicted MPP superfamily phosphohydrolase
MYRPAAASQSQAGARRRLLAAAALGAGAVGAYAWLVEPHWLETTHTRLAFPGLPPELEGLRIALLTDLHLGSGTSCQLIRRAAERAMAASPDLIALTGDFASGDETGFTRVLDALADLRAPLGVYAVPGNHDYIVGIETWHRQIARHARINDLTNRAVLCDVRGVPLCIAGVDDLSEGEPHLDALPPPEARAFTILLAHDPDQAERSRRAYDQIDLILSGHTHGGQLRLPGIGPLRTPLHPERYEMGVRRLPWTTVYTSRGIGTVHLPVRLFCRPEIAILELTVRGGAAHRREAGAVAE